MQDNFNLKKFLRENVLLKTNVIKEAVTSMNTSRSGEGEVTVDLETNQGDRYTLEVNVINEEEVELVSGVDQDGRSLSKDELFELQLDYEKEIAEKYYEEYAEDIEIAKLASKGKTGLDKL